MQNLLSMEIKFLITIFCYHFRFNKSSDGRTIDLIPASQMLSFDVTSFDNVNPGNVEFIIQGKAGMINVSNRTNLFSSFH